MKQRATISLTRKPPANQTELVKSQLDGRFKRNFSSGRLAAILVRRRGKARRGETSDRGRGCSIRERTAVSVLRSTRDRCSGQPVRNGPRPGLYYRRADTIATRFINHLSISAARQEQTLANSALTVRRTVARTIRWTNARVLPPLD